MIQRALIAITALSLGLSLSGCFNPFDPRVAGVHGNSQTAPVPTDATQLMKLFQYCWNNRDYDDYTEVFTDDFTFQFGLADTSGNLYTGHTAYRVDELLTARHLFIEGTGSEPPARSINLILGVIQPVPDSRNGKMFPWHVEMRPSVTLTIDTGDTQFYVTGSATFFAVRGDSALIPKDMVDRGFRRDKNRWYIERWEDNTLGAGGMTAGGGDARVLLKRALAASLARGGASIAAGPGGSVGRAPGVTGAPSTQVWQVTWGWVKSLYNR
jgi:hypothetical protein